MSGNRDIERLLDNLTRKGYVIRKTKSGHWSISHPLVPARQVFAPGTSSDHRGYLNTRAQVRRDLPTPKLRKPRQPGK
jgi:hypothetical protein